MKKAALISLLALVDPSEASRTLRITPELDPKSHEEFFGPPVKTADYPRDQLHQAADVAKVFQEGHYPALQKKSDFDYDFVKDDQKDNGEWKAQYDYDKARIKADRENKEAADAKKKLDAEEADVKAAKAAKTAAEARYGTTSEEAKKADAKRAAAKQKKADAKKNSADSDVNVAKSGAKSGDKMPMADEVATKESNLKAAMINMEGCKEKLEKAKTELDQALDQQAKELQTVHGDKAAGRAAARKEQRESRNLLNDAESEEAEADKAVADASLKTGAEKKGLDSSTANLAEQERERDEALKVYEQEKADADKVNDELERKKKALMVHRGIATGDVAMRAGEKSSASRFAAPLVLLGALFAVASCN